MRLTTVVVVVAVFFSGVMSIQAGKSCGVCNISKVYAYEVQGDIDEHLATHGEDPAVEEKVSSNAVAATDMAVATDVDNKFCPISGEKIIKEKAAKIEYQGKIYNLCCSMCEKDFKKDPEKYIEKITNEAK